MDPGIAHIVDDHVPLRHGQGMPHVYTLPPITRVVQDSSPVAM
jgi:hypothetical protein